MLSKTFSQLRALLLCLTLLGLIPVTGTLASTPTTTTIMADVNPSVSGQTVHFTVQVRAGGASPTEGTVTLNIPGSPAQTKDFFLSGPADLTYSTQFYGNGSMASVTATYSDSLATTLTGFGSSNGTLTQTVNRAGTTVSMPTSTLTPSTFGQPVTLTAHVNVTAPGTGTPSGTITFFDNGAPLGTSSAIDGSENGMLTTSAIGVGTRSITAVYNGDGNYAPSMPSAGLPQQVNQAATSLTSLTSTPNPSGAGDSVTFSVNLSVNAPGAGVPGGSINFQDNGTTFQTAAVTGTGTYTVSDNARPVGTRTITAVYTGDTNFQGTSTSLTQIVKSATTTAITSATPNPSSFGQTVTLQATVSGSAGTPTGTVQFRDGAASLGPPQTLSGGSVSFQTNALSTTTHSITAVYSGDAANGGSTSAPATSVTVNQDTTSVATPTSSNGVVTFGQSVTFSTTVTSTQGQTPTGSVSFQDNGSTIATVNLDSSGHATSPPVTLSATPTTHPITAVYTGSTNFTGSISGTFTQTVNQAATNTALASSANPSSFNQTVTFTATVTSGAGAPTGTVQFQIDGNNVMADGTPGIQAVALTGPGSNQASLSTAALSVGSHTVSASYSGDNNFATGGATLAPAQAVNQAGTTTAVASNNNPSAFGQMVTFTATVTGAFGGLPTGTVTFKDGGATIGTGTVSGGVPATFTTSALGGGTHTITAVYGGDSNFNGSSGTLTPPQTVGAAATTTTVTSSVNPSTFGQPVTFTATVTAGSGVPTGTVTFKDTDGSTLGTGTLSAVGPGSPNAAAATVTLTSLSITNLTHNPPNPPHAVTAVYNSDGNFASSTGALSPAQTVNQAANTVIVTSDSANNQSFFGQTVTFTASVTGGSAGTPTGTVTFFDATTSLGTATLDGTGIARLPTAVLAAGAHTITAAYSGDNNNAPQTSASIIQTVNKAAATAILASNNADPVSGQAVTITATVANTTTGSVGSPTGTVQFQVDSASVKADGTPGTQAIPLVNGQASFSTTSLPVGSRQIAAVYSGDADFVANTGTLTQIVGNPVPTLTRLTPNSAQENDPPTTLTLTGSGFIAVGNDPHSVKVIFNGAVIPADSVSADGTSLTATIPTADLSQPGTVQVGVLIPQQPTESNTLAFQIRSPNGPTLFSSNPTGVLAGLISSNDSLTITLKGSNFATNAVVGYTSASSGGQTVIFNAQNANVTVVDPTTLTFALPGSFLQSSDSAAITVRNPDPGGGGLLVSSPVAFVVGGNPAPFINSLNPTGISVNGNPGTNSFTLTLLGANFLRGAIVTFTDPQNNETTFGTNNAIVNTTGDQVSVTVSNSLVAQSGRYTVQVENIRSLDATTNPPTPSYNGAPLSNTQAFLVSNLKPIVNAAQFSPGFVTAGATTAPNAFSLTIKGSNFDPGATATSQHSTVIFNSTTLPQNSVRVINSTTLIASLDSSLVASAGLASVVVSNVATDGTGQIQSDPVSFPINPVYARATYPSKGIVLFSVPYDYSGANPFDIIKEVTFAPGLMAGGQYFGLGTTPGSNILSGLQDLLSPTLTQNKTARIAQWSPTGLQYLFASAQPTVDLQLQLGQAYWGVGFPDANGVQPGTFGIIKLGAPATVNPYPVPLAKGWNMVGDPFPSSASIFGITVQRAGRVYSFSDAVANGFISPIFWSYEGGPSYASHYPGKADPTSPVKDTLDPFIGYWLLANTDCQLLVPRP